MEIDVEVSVQVRVRLRFLPGESMLDYSGLRAGLGVMWNFSSSFWLFLLRVPFVPHKRCNTGIHLPSNLPAEIT